MKMCSKKTGGADFSNIYQHESNNGEVSLGSLLLVHNEVCLTTDLTNTGLPLKDEVSHFLYSNHSCSIFKFFLKKLQRVRMT